MPSDCSETGETGMSRFFEIVSWVQIPTAGLMKRHSRCNWCKCEIKRFTPGVSCKNCSKLIRQYKGTKVDGRLCEFIYGHIPMGGWPKKKNKAATS